MVYALLGIRYNYPKSIDFGRSVIAFYFTIMNNAFLVARFYII